MKKTGFFLIVCFIGSIHLAVSQKVNLLYDTSLPQAVYAAEKVRKSLLDKGYSLKEEQADHLISLSVDGRDSCGVHYLGRG